jgi:hypothetical protein
MNQHAKIGIICLAQRRFPLIFSQIKQLAKCPYRDFHFYLMIDKIDSPLAGVLERSLPNQHTVVQGFVPNTRNNLNYMQKVGEGTRQPHEFLVKADEDVLLLADGWERFFRLIESMRSDDLYCTGAISNGIPTCDMFVRNFIPESKAALDKMFAETHFPLKPKRVDYFGNADYTALNGDGKTWNPDEFFAKVHSVVSPYKGIHPVRINVPAQKEINRAVMANFPKTMRTVAGEIIRDIGTRYPYFCNSMYGIRAADWRTIISRRDLFADNTDEVPLNRYRNETKRNMVIDTGIPMLHTMYNWAGFDDEAYWQYEIDLVKEISVPFAEA